VGQGESVRKALEREGRSSAWIAEKASQTMDESIAVGQSIIKLIKFKQVCNANKTLFSFCRLGTHATIEPDVIWNKIWMLFYFTERLPALN
jgi:hypothetical protein